MDSRYVDAARAAQSVLKSASPELIADGHWGRHTERVFQAAPISVRNAVIAVVGSYSLTPDQLKRAFELLKLEAPKAKAEKERAQKERVSGPAIALDTVQQKLRQYLLRMAVRREFSNLVPRLDDPRVLTVLTDGGLIRKESGLVPTATNPLTDSKGIKQSASGLFQYIRSSWNNLVTKYGLTRARQFPGQGNAATALFQAATRRGDAGSPGDVDASCEVHAAALAEIVKIFQKKGIPLTVNTLYHAHFQGADKAVAQLRTGNTKDARLDVNPGGERILSASFADYKRYLGQRVA